MKIQPSEIGNYDKDKIWNPGYKLFVYFLKESPFTQWSMIPFKIDGIEYNCAEQWMMACKARFFGDRETLKKIMDADHPRDQKSLGRQVKGFVKSEWDNVAKSFVQEGNVAKFEQNEFARKELLATKDTLLVEVNPEDPIWGIALSRTEAKNGKLWQGTNWLGEVLTKVRNDLSK